MSAVHGHTHEDEMAFVRRFPTIDSYLDWRRRYGHICCPATQRGLRCCFAGHEEAVLALHEFNAIVGVAS